MYNIEKLSDMIKQNKFNECFEKLYGAEQIPYQKNRYLNTLNAFKKHFPECENVGIFSVPGRTEIGGNHTDHQHGAVLAGAIDKDIIAVASINGDNVIRIRSDALADNNVCISDLNTQKTKKQTSDALIEGVTARLFELGANVGGFNAVTSSDIPIGSGLSSSAAFEVLIGLIINSLYNFSSLSELTLAKAARYAENVYFGKSCGLMDQLVCALGGICAIDFKDSENPEYKKINYDFEKSGYSPVIVNTFSCHKDLSEEYSLIPYEMGKVAEFFGKQYLREVDEEKFLDNIKKLRKTAGDRAILRAMHFFSENKNAKAQTKALESGDFNEFLRLFKKSGDSSYKYLQNIYLPSSPLNEDLALALALGENVLGDLGVCRVHGGGFAGTIQAMVPNEKLKIYSEKLTAVFGVKSVIPIKIRQYGLIELSDKLN